MANEIACLQVVNKVKSVTRISPHYCIYPPAEFGRIFTEALQQEPRATTGGLLGAMKGVTGVTSVTGRQV